MKWLGPKNPRQFAGIFLAAERIKHIETGEGADVDGHGPCKILLYESVHLFLKAHTGAGVHQAFVRAKFSRWVWIIEQKSSQDIQENTIVEPNLL